MRVVLRCFCRVLGHLLWWPGMLWVLPNFRRACEWAGYDHATRLSRDAYPSGAELVKALAGRKRLLVRRLFRLVINESSNAEKAMQLKRDWEEWHRVERAIYIFYILALLRTGGPW